MKNLTKNEMTKFRGGLSIDQPKVVKTTMFTGYARNPCTYGKWFQRWYSDGTVKTYSILGVEVEG